MSPSVSTEVARTSSPSNINAFMAERYGRHVINALLEGRTYHFARLAASYAAMAERLEKS